MKGGRYRRGDLAAFCDANIDDNDRKVIYCRQYKDSHRQHMDKRESVDRGVWIDRDVD